MQPEFVEDMILEKYKTVAAATVFSALKDRGHFNCLLEDVYPMTPGKTVDSNIIISFLLIYFDINSIAL